MFSPYQKEEALRVYDSTKSVDQTIRILGYPTRRCLYGWLSQRAIENNEPYANSRKPRSASRRLDNSSDAPDGETAEIWTPEQVEDFQRDLQLCKLQIEIVSETVKLRQTREPFIMTPLTNAEKAAIVDNLRMRYSLHILLEALHLDRSAYYYHHRKNAAS